MKNEPIQVTFKRIVDKLFKKSSKRLFSRDPDGDWVKIFSLSVIVGLVIIISLGYFFYKISIGDFFTNDASPTTANSIFNKSIFKQENEYYDAQEKKLVDLRAEVWPVIDPSI